MILTHQHYDHVGLAHTVRERSGATVVAHRASARLPRRPPGPDGARGHLPGRRDAPARGSRAGDRGALRSLEGAPPLRRLGRRSIARPRRRRGRGGRRAARVHDRPGHSPTDTIFVDEDDAAGDRRRPPDRPHLVEPGHPPAARPPGDRRDRMPALPPTSTRCSGPRRSTSTCSCPGTATPSRSHRRSSRSGSTSTTAARSGSSDGLAGGPQTATSSRSASGATVAERESFLTLSEALGHLDLLEAEGRVVVLDGDDGLLRYAAT